MQVIQSHFASEQTEMQKDWPLPQGPAVNEVQSQDTQAQGPLTQKWKVILPFCSFHTTSLLQKGNQNRWRTADVLTTAWIYRSETQNSATTKYYCHVLLNNNKYL